MKREKYYKDHRLRGNSRFKALIELKQNSKVKDCNEKREILQGPLKNYLNNFISILVVTLQSFQSN